MSQAIYPSTPPITTLTMGVAFRNNIQEAESGKRKGIASWIYPRRAFELNYSVIYDGYLNTEQFKPLIGFFLARRGNLDSFLFDNADDNFVTAQEIGVGDSSETDFQLVRSYGGFIEPCYDIKVSPAPLVYVDGVLQNYDPSSADSSSEEDGYYIDETGVVIFDAPPASPSIITATFGYYWRCTFKDSIAQFEEFKRNLWKGKVSLETVK